MPYFILGLSLILYGLSLNPWALADEILPIAKIMEHPADYQAKVVIVEGRAREVTELPPRFRVHRCAGGTRLRCATVHAAGPVRIHPGRSGRSLQAERDATGCRERTCAYPWSRGCR